MNKKDKTRKIALYGLLIALAMIFGYIEALLPLPVPVPGMKLGLANIVTVVGLYLVGIPGTCFVTVLRIVLTGFSFGNPYSMLYGLAGSALSLIVMAAARHFGWFSVTGVSILGGVAHNIGQLAFAAFIVRTAGVFYYLPALLAAGAAAGALIGLLGGILVRRLGKYIKSGNTGEL